MYVIRLKPLNEQTDDMCKYHFNKYLGDICYVPEKTNILFGSSDILNFHHSINGYKPTPLYSLKSLSGKFGIKNIFVKDESQRFDLNAFKILGASYAIYRFLKKRYEQVTGVEMENLFSPNVKKTLPLYTFCTATDGNHGRAVAWMANKLNQKAVIYIPSDTVTARIESIKKEGAKVVLVNGSYDDAVKMAFDEAKKNDWQVISDTSYENQIEIPLLISAGYTTLFKEIDDQLENEKLSDNDFIFIQCGVGALAATAGWFYNRYYKQSMPTLVCVEPTESACVFDSMKYNVGEITVSRGSLNTIMAGLNCGTPSEIAFPYIKNNYKLFLTINDKFAENSMKTFYNPIGDDPRIISGESGAAGLAALLAIFENRNLSHIKDKLFNKNSRVLLINTEGDTDPENFNKIINS